MVESERMGVLQRTQGFFSETRDGVFHCQLNMLLWWAVSEGRVWLVRASGELFERFRKENQLTTIEHGYNG